MPPCKFKIDAFKGEFHLKTDGAALRLAIEKKMIPPMLEEIFAESGITDLAEGGEIVERLKKVLEDKEGVILRLSKVTVHEETKWIEKENYEEAYKKLGITEVQLQQMVETHVTCMVNSLRSQVRDIIEMVSRDGKA